MLKLPKPGVSKRLNARDFYLQWTLNKYISAIRRKCFVWLVFFASWGSTQGVPIDTMYLSEISALGLYCPFAPQLWKQLHTSISLNGAISLSMAFLPQLLDEMSFEQSVGVMNSLYHEKLVNLIFIMLVGTVWSEAITLNSSCSFQLIVVPQFFLLISAHVIVTTHNTVIIFAVLQYLVFC